MNAFKEILKKISIVIPDKLYLKILFRLKMKKRLNFKQPLTFNEKMQWLKIYYRDDSLTALVDKYSAKEYIKELVGEEYVVPTLGIWKRFEDIDFSKLPDRFVLKTTHDSGGIVVCRDSASFNLEQARSKISKSIKRNFYWCRREKPYKRVKRLIMAEKFLSDSDGNGLTDYKFFCFNGEPKIMFVATDRFSQDGVKFDFFDMGFNHLDLINGHPNASKLPKKPLCFDKMIELSKILSKGFPFIRCDFYECDGRVYVGELTLFHNAGMVPFKPDKWDALLGSWIELPKYIKS